MKKKERIDFYISLIVISIFGCFITYYSFTNLNNTEDVSSLDLEGDNPIENIEDKQETIVLKGITYRSRDLENNRLSRQRTIDGTENDLDTLYTYNVPKRSIPIPIVEPTNKVFINLDSLKNANAEVENTIGETKETGSSVEEEKSEDAHTVSELAISNAETERDERVQVKDSNSTKDCIIIIGAFSKQMNVKKLLERLNKEGYDSFTTPFKGLTRVGVRLTCEESTSKRILSEVRSRYAKDAVLMDRE